MNHRGLLFVPFLLAIPIPVSGEFSKDAFKRMHQELQPGSDETWRTIPWKTSVLAAQKIAGEQQKPIFIWAMDGHPLGCT